jgi:phosphatidylinositol-3-phosphatase
VAVVVLENRGYRQVVGNPRVPYINRLARRYSLATRYYAVAHPSVPNYLALTGGSTFGVRSDCGLCDADAPNLVNQLSAAVISWRAYFENLPSAGRLGMRTALYTVHYDPFAYFETVSASALERSRIVSFGALHRDLSLARLPRFSWIAPNLSHDGHSSSLEATDRYVSKLVPRIIRALGPHGVLYLTWDEGSGGAHAGVGGVRGGGRVALIAAGGAARRAATSATPADHYALLRTIEAGFRLRALGRAGATSTPLLSGLLREVARGHYS